MYMDVNGVRRFLTGDPFGWREPLQLDLEANALFTMSLAGPFYYWASLFIHVINL
jgi:hypothetical protein